MSFASEVAFLDIECTRIQRGIMQAHREKELANLIIEQRQEQKQESSSVFVKGKTNSYEKGRKGIFVGNRIF